MSDDSSLTILFQKPNLTSWQKERIKQQSEKPEESPERRKFEKLCLLSCFFRPKSRTQQNQQKAETERFLIRNWKMNFTILMNGFKNPGHILIV